MFPVLFEIGPLKIHSFGLMVMIAFLVGGWLVTQELRRRGLVPDHLEGYPMLALVGGIEMGETEVATLGHVHVADGLGIRGDGVPDADAAEDASAAERQGDDALVVAGM